MKKALFICCLAIIIVACQEDKKKATYSKESTTTKQQDEFQEKKEVQENKEDAFSVSKKENLTKAIAWDNQFIKTNAVTITCKCNCLNINFNSVQTLCIDKKLDIYIQVKYLKKEGHVELLYLNGKGNIDDKNPIPWSDFDKNGMIAKISRDGNQIHLDWRGFTINNQLAKDYAILGKKNLEGNYKIK